MVSKVPILPIEVEFEQKDGMKKMKKLETGEHPIDALAGLLVDMDRDYRREHNDAPMVEVCTLKAQGDRGEPAHYESNIYSLESGERELIAKAIVIDRATGKPAPILDPSDKKYVPKAESLFHVEQKLSYERLKEAGKKRGLQILADASIKHLQELKKLEG